MNGGGGGRRAPGPREGGPGGQHSGSGVRAACRAGSQALRRGASGLAAQRGGSRLGAEWQAMAGGAIVN